MKKFILLSILAFVSASIWAHPIEQFQGLWKGECSVTGHPPTLMSLEITPTTKANRLKYIIGYKSPQKDFEYRNYALITNPLNHSRVILDEGEGALFEERWEENILFGLLRNGQIRMHSLFKFESLSKLSIQMTIFKINPNKIFGSPDSPLEDYSPQSIQNCLLKK